MSATIGEMYTFALKDGFVVDGETGFILQPYDQIYVRRSPGYQPQANLNIQGEILYDGRDITKVSIKKMKEIRKEIGMLFQGSALFDSETVEGNVMFPLKMFSDMSYAEMKERAQFCIHRVNLDGANHKYPSEISGGMQKRVAIARALVNKPAVVLADEPTGNLDSETRNDIQQLFFELRERTGQTFVIVTHDSALADGSDRKITMKDGEII